MTHATCAAVASAETQIRAAASGPRTVARVIQRARRAAALAAVLMGSATPAALAAPVEVRLAVTGPAEVVVNTQATYEVVVHNDGPNEATQNTFSIINTQTWKRAVSLRATQGTCTLDGTAPSCELGSIPANSHATVTATYEANEFARDDGNITFQSFVYGDEDQDESNNKVSQPVRFVPPPRTEPPPESGPPPGLCLPAEGCTPTTPASIPRAGDLCPGATDAGRELIAGCSRSAVLVEPTLATRPALRDVDDARGRMAGTSLVRRAFEGATTRLARVKRELAAAARELDRLDMCDASDAAIDASAAARSARSAAVRGARTAKRRLARRPPARTRQVAPTYADGADLHMNEDSAIEFGPSAAAEAAAEAARVAKVMRGLCRSTGKVRTVNATITDVLPDGSVKTSSGTRISFDGYDGKVVPMMGLRVRVRGPVLGGVLQAETVTQNAKAAPAPPATAPCLLPGVDPSTSFPYKFNRLPLAGYAVAADALLLEVGMALGAIPAPSCDTNAGGGFTWRHELVMVLNGENFVRQERFDSSTRAGFPVLDAKPFTLHARETRVRCARTVCQAPQVVWERTWKVETLRRGGAAGVRLSQTVFDLVDSPTPPSYGYTDVTVDNPWSLPNPSIVGFGRAAAAGGGPSPSALGTVRDGMRVAVHPDDEQAVRWPQVIGKRNGSPYVYSASTPNVVTDRLAQCNSSDPLYADTDAYYGLPWPADRTEGVGQGAKDNSTDNHSNSYAWDFGMAAGTPIVAARGGIVTEVIEDRSLNYFKEQEAAAKEGRLPWFAGNNHVIIRHRDGTASGYAHMQTDSVIPIVGERVRRGDVIATVGEVGQATGPHIHIAVFASPVDPRDETKTPALFSGWRVADGKELFESCAVPKKGELWKSANAKA